MSELNARIKEFLEEEQGETLKHLTGRHDQKRHGNRGVKGNFAEFVPISKWEEGGRQYRKDDMSKEYFEKKYPNRKLPTIKPSGSIINTHLIISVGKNEIGGVEEIGYEMVSGPFRLIPNKDGTYKMTSLGKSSDENYFSANSVKYNPDGYFDIAD